MTILSCDFGYEDWSWARILPVVPSGVRRISYCNAKRPTTIMTRLSTNNFPLERAKKKYEEGKGSLGSGGAAFWTVDAVNIPKALKGRKVDDAILTAGTGIIETVQGTEVAGTNKWKAGDTTENCRRYQNVKVYVVFSRNQKTFQGCHFFFGPCQRSHRSCRRSVIQTFLQIYGTCKVSDDGVEGWRKTKTEEEEIFEHHAAR